jgi:GntR family transcriptional regulator of arabinose operon
MNVSSEKHENKAGVRETDRTPLYLQVKELIKEYLRKGNYPLGGQLPTNHEFSELMNVSQLTVQKAVNTLVKEGVLYTRRGKGTFVQNLSSSVRSKPQIGIYATMIPTIQGNTVAAFVNALDDLVFSKRGDHMFLCNSQYDLEREITLLDSLLERSIDVLIYQINPLLFIRPVFVHAIDFRLQKFLSAGVPVIMIDRFVKPDRYDTVEPDKTRMAELQVAHLLELGHRRLLFVGFETISQVIEAGWKKTAAMLGLGADQAKLLLVPEEEKDAISRGLDQVLAGGWPFTAIVASTDGVAVSCYQHLKSLGIQCPRDISIIGADNLEHVQAMDFPMTTVWSEPDEIARQVQFLIEERRSSAYLSSIPVKHIEVAPKLIIRQSTSSPATSMK